MAEKNPCSCVQERRTHRCRVPGALHLKRPPRAHLLKKHVAPSLEPASDHRPSTLSSTPTKHHIETMQRQEAQEPQPAAAPDSHSIGAAPPAYSPQPQQAVPEATPNQTPVPVKGLPSDLNAQPSPLPTMSAAPQKTVAGAAQQGPGARVVPLDRLGSEPQWIDCPFCHERTRTRLQKDGQPMQM
jgi:hypothetical protein